MLIKDMKNEMISKFEKSVETLMEDINNS